MSENDTPAQDGAQPGGEQQEFTPPATQEDLNRIIADRLARERAKFADYNDLKAKADQLQVLEDAQKTEAQKAADALAAAQAELTAYKQREQVANWADEIVKGSHIPASALRGTTEEELRGHFEQLKSLIPEPDGRQKPHPRVSQTPPPALNSSALEDSLRRAVGAN